jgi:hypothetical protein
MYSLFDDEKKRSLVPQTVFVYSVILLSVILQGERETGYSTNSHSLIAWVTDRGSVTITYYNTYKVLHLAENGHLHGKSHDQSSVMVTF